MIDSHCHLDFPDFDADRDEVLTRAVDAGVRVVINPGTDLETSRKAITLTERYDNVYAGVGVHPHHASTLDERTLTELRRLASHPKVVAIGEIGLDYYRDFSPRSQQRVAFEAQLTLAADLDLPVIVHQRESAADVMTSLRAWAEDEHPSCVLHAFSGDETMADEAVSLGFFIGVGGPVAFQSARGLPEIIPHLPLSCLMIETDAPFLAPHPHRGKRNEPAYVALVAERLAQLFGIPRDELARHMTENTLRLFQLPSSN